MSDILEQIVSALQSDSDARRDEALDSAHVEITRLREQLADTEADYLRRHRDACDKWEALMDIRMVANEPGDRRALIDKIFGIATKALRAEVSRFGDAVGNSLERGK